ncbi:MAG: YdeI/OmpD-associated family protein [Chloroflexi bacterium]|nr:YdeI/OmpD-associated family protein [Chloroflexota bacterium]
MSGQLAEELPIGAKRDLPVISFPSREAWEAWLAEHHSTSKGLWLKIARKGSGIDSVSYAEALEVALCYGWIDGQKDKLDERHWLQRFTPRGPRSKWSKINRDKATALMERGEMRPAGLREVERARADGRWDAAYDAWSAAEVPDDLRRALDQNDRAREFFSTLDSRNRYAILYRLQDAKKPETRARWLETFVAMLDEGKTIYP